MKRNQIIVISILYLFASCAPEKDELQPNIENKIKVTLEKLAIENLKSWEPPFHEEKFLNAFTHDDDLLVILDGFTITNYERWKNVVFESMQADRVQKYKMYRHIVNDIYTAVLSSNAGVVTMSYTWDYLINDDLHYNTEATATLVFKLEKENWKIIQFVVYHGKEILI